MILTHNMWLMEELQVHRSLCRLSCRAGAAFAQSVADERCPLDTKCESNYGNFVKVIKPRSVSGIYFCPSDLQRENKVGLVNVCREHLCHYLLLNVGNCTRWYGSSSSSVVFLYDPWQSTKSQISIHSEMSNNRTLSLAWEQQWNVIYVNRKACSVVTRG